VQKVIGDYRETARSKTADSRRVGFAGTFATRRGWGTLYVRRFGRDFCQLTVIAAEGTTVLIDPVVETAIGGLVVTGYAPLPVGYLALGDSYAAGAGASDPASKGYAGLFAASLRGNGAAIQYTTRRWAG
jgi:hypothetical protein